MPTLSVDVRLAYEPKTTPGTLYYECPLVRAQDEHLPQDHTTPPQLRHEKAARSPSTPVVNAPPGEQVAVGMNRPVLMVPQGGGGNQW
jgi:hypothetical protein